MYTSESSQLQLKRQFLGVHLTSLSLKSTNLAKTKWTALAVHLAPAGINLQWRSTFTACGRSNRRPPLITAVTQVLALLSCRLRGNVQLTAFVPALIQASSSLALLICVPTVVKCLPSSDSSMSRYLYLLMCPRNWHRINLQNRPTARIHPGTNRSIAWHG